MKTGPKPRGTLAERFWPKVIKHEEGCWGWLASTDHNGYPQMGLGGRAAGMTRASRVSWVLHYGPIPDGLMVLHRCDNRLCVRPEHLELGDQTKNMGDAKRRGRISIGDAHAARLPRGERHWNAQLTEEQVAAIRAMQGKAPSRAVARMVGTSKTHVLRIWHGTSRVAP